jgi:tetratricopeptide (TPR) repeat protein
MSLEEISEDKIIACIQVADEIENASDAEDRYLNCLEMIPEPKYESIYATQIFMSLGEISYLASDYKKALSYYSEAIKCAGALGNPSIHLRLGQIRFELGDIDRAEDELMRAYMGGGVAIFEFEDPKYYLLIQKHIR